MTAVATSILIVEDDPIIALELEQVLRQQGYRIAGKAHSAVQAIDRLAAGGIDFAILDINLGSGQSGIDVARIIHRKYELPYIFLTAFADEHTLTAAQEQAPYGYLVKPFQTPTLLSTISVALSNYRRLRKG
ncbi:MAG: response regulator, partial [Bacteroidetes bacterium]